ncbi:MAG TPA: ATP synthase F0 subunit B [Candidatus Angelobacter sp.]|nr:ATP synthase F0 subunit B [Candidatus Angelobacter sp.]
MEIVTQVGELLLYSIPTIICLLVVWGAYRVLVHGKLQKVLAERHARTEGAMEQARQAIASAEQRTAEYEQKLRNARTQIYAAQESYRKRMMDRRAQMLAETRRQSDEMVKKARAAVEQEMVTVKAGLQSQVEALADQIIQSILRPAVAAGEP